MKALKREEIFDINYRVIGRNIMQLRNKAGFRQDDIAEKIGISMTHYSNCERGTKHFALEHILAICQLLNVSLDQVLAGAISDVRISSSAEGIEDNDENELLDEICVLQKGCSDEAKKSMVESCRIIANLDKLRY